MSEYNCDDASDDPFAVIILSLGGRVGFLLIEPFDGEPPKVELQPTNTRLEGDEVVEMFWEIALCYGR